MDNSRKEHFVQIYSGSVILYERTIKGRNEMQAASDAYAASDPRFEVTSILVNGKEFAHKIEGTANYWLRLDVFVIRMLRQKIQARYRSKWVNKALLKAFQEIGEEKQRPILPERKLPHAFLANPAILEKAAHLEFTAMPSEGKTPELKFPVFNSSVLEKAGQLEFKAL